MVHSSSKPCTIHTYKNGRAIGFLQTCIEFTDRALLPSMLFGPTAISKDQPLINLEKLESFLATHQVPLTEWGKGKAKTLDHLLDELTKGECYFEKGNDQFSLIRRVEGVQITVFHDTLDGRLRLNEDRQVFNDGRTRRRPSDFSVGEKMSPGETPHQSATRALAEELGIVETVPLVFKETIEQPVSPSTSYPGLGVRHRDHTFEVILPTSAYRPEGYIEIQPDKKSYFQWHKI